MPHFKMNSIPLCSSQKWKKILGNQGDFQSTVSPCKLQVLSLPIV